MSRQEKPKLHASAGMQNCGGCQRQALRLKAEGTDLDFLTEALDGQAVDWPHWPIDRWASHYKRYSQKSGEELGEESSSRKGNI